MVISSRIVVICRISVLSSQLCPHTDCECLFFDLTWLFHSLNNLPNGVPCNVVDNCSWRERLLLELFVWPAL